MWKQKIKIQQYLIETIFVLRSPGSACYTFQQTNDEGHLDSPQ